MPKRESPGEAEARRVAAQKLAELQAYVAEEAAGGSGTALGPGWAVAVKQRRGGSSKGSWDPTYLSPPGPAGEPGEAFRSKKAVLQFLRAASREEGAAAPAGAEPAGPSVAASPPAREDGGKEDAEAFGARRLGELREAAAAQFGRGLAPGWRVDARQRATGVKKGQWDVAYVSPEGTRFTSKVKALHHVGQAAGPGPGELEEGAGAGARPSQSSQPTGSSQEEEEALDGLGEGEAGGEEEVEEEEDEEEAEEAEEAEEEEEEEEAAAACDGAEAPPARDPLFQSQESLDNVFGSDPAPSQPVLLDNAKFANVAFFPPGSLGGGDEGKGKGARDAGPGNGPYRAAVVVIDRALGEGARERVEGAVQRIQAAKELDFVAACGSAEEVEGCLDRLPAGCLCSTVALASALSDAERPPPEQKELFKVRGKPRPASAAPDTQTPSLAPTTPIQPSRHASKALKAAQQHGTSLAALVVAPGAEAVWGEMLGMAVRRAECSCSGLAALEGGGGEGPVGGSPAPLCPHCLHRQLLELSPHSWWWQGPVAFPGSPEPTGSFVARQAEDGGTPIAPTAEFAQALAALGPGAYLELVSTMPQKDVPHHALEFTGLVLDVAPTDEAAERRASAEVLERCAALPDAILGQLRSREAGNEPPSGPLSVLLTRDPWSRAETTPELCISVLSPRLLREFYRGAVGQQVRDSRVSRPGGTLSIVVPPSGGLPVVSSSAVLRDTVVRHVAELDNGKGASGCVRGQIVAFAERRAQKHEQEAGSLSVEKYPELWPELRPLFPQLEKTKAKAKAKAEAPRGKAKKARTGTPRGADPADPDDAVAEWQATVARVLTAFRPTGEPVREAVGAPAKRPASIKTAAKVLGQVHGNAAGGGAGTNTEAAGLPLSPRSQYGKKWWHEGTRQATLPRALAMQHAMHGSHYFQGTLEARKRELRLAKAVAKCEMRLARMGRAYSSAGLDAYEVLLHQKVHAAASKAELRKLKEDLKEVRRVQRKYAGTKPAAAPQAK